jgi:pimeloyl-ACP methyl ester carboxylesterase
VVLLPGLWGPAASMLLLGARLKARGYVPHIFSYHGRHSLESNIEQLLARVREALDRRPAHYVGHSFGGVLVFETLNRHADLPVATAVLLGAPLNGCLAGRRFGRAYFGRWMLGASAGLWSDRRARWQRSEPLGVIAGSVPLGLGRVVLGALPGVNDGVVCIEETQVEGMADRVVVPVAHSGMIASSRVARLIERFMATGRFE